MPVLCDQALGPVTIEAASPAVNIRGPTCAVSWSNPFFLTLSVHALRGLQYLVSHYPLVRMRSKGYCNRSVCLLVS